MCYAAPGPRCSAHARKSLDLAQGKHERLKEEVAEARYLFSEDESDLNRTILGNLRDRLFRAEDVLRVARQEYDATPGGIADMKAQLTRLHEEMGPAAALDDYEHMRLLQRIEEGQLRRLEQLTAYKAANHLSITSAESTEDHQVDAPEDEAAAMREAPRCQCITYKYKGDCEHVAAQVEKDRRLLVPTSLEASLDLHRANAELRQAREKYQAAAKVVRDAGGNPDDDTDAWALYLKVAAAEGGAGKAVRQFARTRAGQEHYQALADEELAHRGYNTGRVSQIRDLATDGAKEAGERAVRFTEMTGLPAPADTTTGPPELMYGNGCDCRDFQWTGDCVHRNPQRAAIESFADALARTPEVRTVGKAVKRLDRESRGGVLSRLRERLSR